jgi:hypothetical protein
MAPSSSLSRADIVCASMELIQPGYPTRHPLDSLVASCKHIMDMDALELSRTLGQGFRILLQNGLQKDLRETLESISEITVALGHYQRGGRYAPSLSDIIAARTITQHRPLSLAPPFSDIPQPDECIYNATRVSALIYSDMVLFPLPPQAGVKPKLADMLRRALDCCTIQSCWRGGSHPRLLLWTGVVGGIAASSTSQKPWYASRLHKLSTKLRIYDWELIKKILSSFLWWDYICEEPAKRLWHESDHQRKHDTGWPQHSSPTDVTKNQG